MIFLRRLALMLALVMGVSFSVPEPAQAASVSTACKKKKKRKKKRYSKKRKKRRKKSKKARKVTAKSIKRWQKKGLSNEEIVEKALAKGWKNTKRNRKKLRRARVRKSLRKAFLAQYKASKNVDLAATSAPAAAKPINIHETIDPDDIDFDSVPPPDGMPAELARQHREEAARKPVAKVRKKRGKRRVVVSAKN